MIALIALMTAVGASAAVATRPRANALPPAELVRLALNLDARARAHIGLHKYDEAIVELGSARARLRDAIAGAARPSVTRSLVSAERFASTAIAQLRNEPPRPLRALTAIHSADVAARSALARLSVGRRGIDWK